jgi:acetate kinase
VKHGISVDTSMGLTPVEGMIMGTRSGDLDLGVLTFIMNKEEIGVASANTLINKHSGMLGISGVSSDMREVKEAALKGDRRSKLALKMFSYRIKKYIGAYCAALGGMDIVVFTGGIGENDRSTRMEICEDMEFLGIKLDTEKNNSVRGKEGIISSDDSLVKVIVIPTNEELVIAEDTMDILQSHNII